MGMEAAKNLGGLNTGESHSTRIDVPRADPRDPMTEEEIAVKFTRLGWRRHRPGSLQEVAELHHES